MTESVKQPLSTPTNKLFGLFAWMGVLLLIALMVFQRHQHTGYFNWRSKMWGDPAGYYVYAPALFIYGFDGHQFPENIAAKTGDGFAIDENGKVITRYTSGVALLQAPVFLMVHAFAGLTGQPQDGFSGAYHLVSSWAAILYAFGGLLLLWRFMLFYYKRTIAFFSLVTLFFGTNLLYYTIDATGMSHIYSFFLFALLLFAAKRFFTEVQRRKKNRYFALVAFTSAFIVLVRPTNLVMVGLVFLLDVDSWKQLKVRFIQVFTFKRILLLVTAFFLVFLPQMLYWKYASGKYITDSYEGYGFTNWASPQVIKFLFSTNNGLFPYNPVYLIIFLALFYMLWKKNPNGYYIFTAFVGLIYLFSSWFIFSFGCGFGSRNFVEYTAVFALPLGFLYKHVAQHSSKIKFGIIGFTLLFILINLKLTSAYDKCFLGGDWDFKEYAYFLKSRKYTGRTLYSEKEVLTPEKEYSKGISVNLHKSTCVNYRRAFVSLHARVFEPSTEAMIVLAITSQDSTIYWNGFALKNEYNFSRQGEEQSVTADFYLPRYYTTNSSIATYVWNIGKDSLQVSKIKLYLE